MSSKKKWRSTNFIAALKRNETEAEIKTVFPVSVHQLTQ